MSDKREHHSRECDEPFCQRCEPYRDPRIDPKPGDVLKLRGGVGKVIRRTPCTVTVDYGDGVWDSVRYGVPSCWDSMAKDAEVIHAAE